MQAQACGPRGARSASVAPTGVFKGSYLSMAATTSKRSKVPGRWSKAPFHVKSAGCGTIFCQFMLEHVIGAMGHMHCERGAPRNRAQ